jgi:hypothetical protein
MDVCIYMRRDGDSEPVEITEKFSGLRYAKCEGLLDKGKRKDVYTEKYADSDELRVWMSDSINREATTISLTVYFTGADRHSQYNQFYDFINNRKIYYWDTKRLKQAYMILIDKLDPKEEVHLGSIPYIGVTAKFQNLWGECKDCNEDGTLINNADYEN